MSIPSHVMWCDLETTDTDPYAAHAAVLEIGVIITRHDPELTEVARASLLIRPPGLQSDHDLMWSRMVPFVQEMHANNGLWREATTSDEAWGLAAADTELARWITTTVRNDGGEVPLPIAGSGVAHMDHPWVKAHLPAVASRLTYWMLDTGQIRRMLELAGRSDHVDMAADVDAKPHRGLDDVTLHVAEARRYLALLGRLPTIETDPLVQPAADTRPLPENIDGHALGPFHTHPEDGRMCGWHNRLGAWAFDSVTECLREHPDAPRPGGG